MLNDAPWPATGGSSTRSPPIARHSSRETYSPSPDPSSPDPSGRRSHRRSAGAALEPAEQPLAIRLRDAAAPVGDGQPQLRDVRRRDDRDDLDRHWPALAVLDGVVEERPQHLVELVRVGDGQPAVGAVVEGRTPRRRRRAPPTPSGPAPPSATTSARGLKAPDSRRVTVRSWRTIRDSRSDCSAMIPSRRSGRSSLELLGMGADAGQRRLEVVADAAQELVLRRVELDELGVLRLDLGEQLGVADRDRDLAREQLEQVLVGALPATASRAAGRTAPRGPPPPARRTARSGRDSPGTTSSIGIVRGVAQVDGRVDHPERGLRVVGRARGQELGRRPVARPPRWPRGSAPAPGCGAAGRPPAGCGSRRGAPARRRRRPGSGVDRSPAETRSTARRERRGAARSGPRPAGTTR